MKDGIMTRTVALPTGFEEAARRLGYDVQEYVWMLAEAACGRPPKELRELTDCAAVSLEGQGE